MQIVKFYLIPITKTMMFYTENNLQFPGDFNKTLAFDFPLSHHIGGGRKVLKGHVRWSTPEMIDDALGRQEEYGRRPEEEETQC